MPRCLRVCPTSLLCVSCIHADFRAGSASHRRSWHAETSERRSTRCWVRAAASMRQSNLQPCCLRVCLQILCVCLFSISHERCQASRTLQARGDAVSTDSAIHSSLRCRGASTRQTHDAGNHEDYCRTEPPRITRSCRRRCRSHHFLLYCILVAPCIPLLVQCTQSSYGIMDQTETLSIPACTHC